MSLPLTLAQAQTVIDKILAHGRAAQMKPLGVVVMDARGMIIASAMSDGCSMGRFDIAAGKARACLVFNAGSRTVEKLAKDRPHFFQGLVSTLPAGVIPVGGGVLIKNGDGTILGSAGVTGDTSDNDEAAALAGIAAAGLVGDGGQG